MIVTTGDVMVLWILPIMHSFPCFTRDTRATIVFNTKAKNNYLGFKNNCSKGKIKDDNFDGGR